MLSRKWLLIGMVASLTLIAGSVQAASRAQVLKQGVDKVMTVMGGEEGLAVMVAVDVLKQSGLSYQPGLTVPTTGVTACKDKEQLRTLLGMYVYDGMYAAVFGKKKDLMTVRRTMMEELFPKLNMLGEKKMRTLPPATLKKVVDDPANPNNRKIILKNWMAQFDRTLKMGEKDPAMMAVMVDAVYGASVEATYLGCKLALMAGMGGKVLDVFNVLSVRLNKLDKVLNAFADNQELSAMVERDQRRQLITPIISILREKKGKLAKADVETILGIMGPVRAALVKKCP